MSVLSSTHSGLHQKLTEIELFERGYSVRIGSFENTYEKDLEYRNRIKIIYNKQKHIFEYNFSFVEVNPRNGDFTKKYTMEFDTLYEYLLIEQYHNTNKPKERYEALQKMISISKLNIVYNTYGEQVL